MTEAGVSFCSVALKIFSYISSSSGASVSPLLPGNNKPVCDLLYKNFLISACMSDTVCTIPKKKKENYCCKHFYFTWFL